MKKQNTINNRLYFNPSLACLHPKVGEIDIMSLIPHRSEAYAMLMKKIDKLLLKILGNEDFSSILLSGNGTLANEIMVANLMLSSKNPAVLINGEFGDRLYAQCLKYNPNTVAIDFGFANNIDVATLELKLTKIDALFFVALETSAGMMNPVKQICKVCEELNIKIGIDAISAMGSEKIDFSSKNISFIATSSGKNLVSIPGIAIVFVRNTLKTSACNTLATSIDMGYLLKSKHMQGLVNNTLSYFLVKALYISLDALVNTAGLDHQYERYRKYRQMIIVAMDTINISMLENCNTTNVLSFYCPSEAIWDRIIKVLEEEDIVVYHEAIYLKRNHIFQIAYMGFYKKEDIERLLYAFSKVTKIK